MSTTTRNRLESRYGGITLTGTPHALSAWTVVALRFVMGGMMLFAGLGKFAFVSGEAFDASGFLVHGVDAASPVSGLYAAMAGNAVVLETINVIIPVTQVLIGVALIAGAFVRLAALGGAIQMVAFYLGGWEGQWLAAFDNTLIYAVAFVALGAFAAGRIAGLDRYIERIEVGGVPLIERYPKLRYVLG
ncbi:DoxX family protein [Halovivax sp.]|uniref:DoxX family protein n=1 Tax=Halovivax sp. TaxID=1935978 RepID=UPI0025BCDC34|nr:DoxX family protein [Halovivax sp.]